MNVYYPKNDGMGLVAVSRTIRTEKDDKYTAAMKSLLAGTKEKDQTNVIPKKAKLRSVSVKDGIATADFSKELQQNFSGGSTGEEMLVGSIVNTLTEFPEVQKVRILIDGAAGGDTLRSYGSLRAACAHDGASEISRKVPNLSFWCFCDTIQGQWRTMRFLHVCL